MRIYKVATGMIFSLLSTPALCQVNNDVEMANVLRSDGKIYTVVFGLIVILTGLIVFVLKVERKVTRLENEEKTKDNPYSVNK